MVLLENVKMNVYKLTTQQNNLTVSEFHSFTGQNDVCNLEEQECPRRPSALQTEDTIRKVMWNGLLNRGLIVILTNLFSIKIAKEMMKSKRIKPARVLFPIGISRFRYLSSSLRSSSLHVRYPHNRVRYLS